MFKQKLIKILGKVGLKRLCRHYLNKKDWKGSADYWQNRYSIGLDSGVGSYNQLAVFKAKVVNDFVLSHNINKVLEFGCGDGNQLLLANYPSYIGYDVAQDAIKMCNERFKNDINKQFIWSGAPDFICTEKAELVISLDVIYHLVEDDVYVKYMRQLFDSSEKYVCIYSCNYEGLINERHVKPRKFTDWIEQNCSDGWKMITFVKNDYPFDPNDPKNTSFSDFYFFEHINCN